LQGFLVSGERVSMSWSEPLRTLVRTFVKVTSHALPCESVSVRFHRGGWEVRWRDGKGRKRAWRFTDEHEARELDAKMALLAPAKRAPSPGRGHTPGVYSYQTTEGVRWYFSYRRADGRQTNRRGYKSQRAATAARRRTLYGGHHGDMTLEQYWSQWLEARVGDLSPGTRQDYERHGRLRILPQLGHLPMAELGRHQLERFEQHLATRVSNGELAAKTARNTRVLLRTVLRQQQAEQQYPSGEA
jgi:hypothetical protein